MPEAGHRPQPRAGRAALRAAARAAADRGPPRHHRGRGARRAGAGARGAANLHRAPPGGRRLAMSDGDQLISAHLDGELDEDGQRRLDAWLAADREHQRRFLRLVMDHRALAERTAVERFRTRGRKGETARRPAARRPAWPRRGALAAGLALALAGAWAWWHAQA